jgi:DMSO/TMAO reductase YedYZ molybdopterin-dependent catalytic subunit
MGRADVTSAGQSRALPHQRLVREGPEEGIKAMDTEQQDFDPYRETVLSAVVSRARFLGLVGLGFGALYFGLKALVFPGGFRFNTVENPEPQFNEESYRFIVDGLVERPLSLTYAELLALPSVKQVSDFHCVEGWGVDNVPWEGIRLSTLISMVKPKPEARFLTFHSLTDTYRDSLSIQQAMLPDAILAYKMYDKPLPEPHGYPLRLIYPRMYGYKGAKWVYRVSFENRREVGYWEQRGWSIDAWIDKGDAAESEAIARHLTEPS